jgi:hypothetical protein
MRAAPISLGELLRHGAEYTPTARQDILNHISNGFGKILRGAPDGGWTAVEASLDDAVAEMLDVSVGEIFASAWKKLRQLQKSLDQSLRHPDSLYKVSLYDYVIRSHHQPKISIYRNNSKVKDIYFNLDLVFEVNSVDLIIKNGKILEIASGHYTASGVLSLYKLVIINLSTRSYDIPGRITL